MFRKRKREDDIYTEQNKYFKVEVGSGEIEYEDMEGDENIEEDVKDEYMKEEVKVEEKNKVKISKFIPFQVRFKKLKNQRTDMIE
mmetsp:Transcript_25724/g.22826  ORF Transcript_25724/g.22826 Transcript_25724/m.22826 type:complete len:85 (+) Transcript_25724:23-277(+)